VLFAPFCSKPLEKLMPLEDDVQVLRDSNASRADRIKAAGEIVLNGDAGRDDLELAARALINARPRRDVEPELATAAFRLLALGEPRSMEGDQCLWLTLNAVKPAMRTRSKRLAAKMELDDVSQEMWFKLAASASTPRQWDNRLSAIAYVQRTVARAITDLERAFFGRITTHDLGRLPHKAFDRPDLEPWREFKVIIRWHGGRYRLAKLLELTASPSQPGHFDYRFHFIDEPPQRAHRHLGVAARAIKFLNSESRIGQGVTVRPPPDLGEQEDSDEDESPVDIGQDPHPEEQLIQVLASDGIPASIRHLTVEDIAGLHQILFKEGARLAQAEQAAASLKHEDWKEWFRNKGHLEGEAEHLKKFREVFRQPSADEWTHFRLKASRKPGRPATLMEAKACITGMCTCLAEAARRHQ
jgi:hypothetical protein